MYIFLDVGALVVFYEFLYISLYILYTICIFFFASKGVGRVNTFALSKLASKAVSQHGLLTNQPAKPSQT